MLTKALLIYAQHKTVQSSSILKYCYHLGSMWAGVNQWTYNVDREIFVLKIFCALKFHGAKFS